MIDPAIRAHIETVLAAIAATEGVRVLFAAESGSRAWGFGSPDSDYDVRFIYAHPPAWYLGLADGRDVIERPLEDHLIDLGGWDVRKTLRLMLKSNPVPYEWFGSPIVYADDGAFRAAAMTLFEHVAGRDRVAHHYHAIARKHWQTEIAGRDDVKLKKYFYVIRPLLSLAWVARNDRPPPMTLDALMDGVGLEPAIRRRVEDLRERKQRDPELRRAPRIAELDDWLSAELSRLDPAGLELPVSPAPDRTTAADELFQRTIGFAP